MKYVLSPTYEASRKKLLEFIENFEREGRLLNDGQRNSIKLFDLEAQTINIKSFKVPNAINKIAYRFFRKSKAQRSFEYAGHLISKNIGTPFPIAYAEETSALGFQESYYVSEHLPYELTYRELVTQPDFPDHEEILRAFTRFTFQLHENSIEFLDHSPGNTLIQIDGGEYKFYLVDLNRMNFRNLSFEDRMKNFARLTPKKEMVEVMANEYSKLITKPEAEVFNKMWMETLSFQEKFHRKQRMKKKLKFWKKA
ncbi:Kdo domain containing protein [Antarcticibacterium flavum]|uniref:Kdo domain containing protein n=1 Tax=Antarcticibacterium flavum TaxID=2058175 RepID=A0A5B7X6D5_9FLAO|nr:MULTISPECIES: lipopolysaccharide kinase InaA family protein [Antarcticibacterium]MCM4159357.1 Kdo domain containing protein [Antarcticibacterium sp. W02-3]QCY70939.1 Kdo domain containing protein [Antarcticibacterium flavum]